MQAVAAAGGLSVSRVAADAATTITGMASNLDPQGMVRIGGNECWTSPFPSAAAAGAAAVQHGNRYEPSDLRGQLIRNVSAVEKVPVDHIVPWPGASDPLARAVVTFCLPTAAW